MKATDTTPKTAAAVRPKRRAKGSPPGQPRGQLDGPKALERRAQQKFGGYKRVGIFLGVEAAIALRQLMRDGRSAREVIEALLLAERQRRKEHATTR
jgi:hypothetical protein